MSESPAEQAQKKPIAECKAAFDWFDENLPGETIDIMHKFAALGWNTQQIWNQVWKFFPPELQARMSDAGKVYTAMAIEYTVRKENS